MVKHVHLLRRQHLPNGIHVAGQSRDGQQRPTVAARQILQAAPLSQVLSSRPIQQVRWFHRLGACPVGIILGARRPRRHAERACKTADRAQNRTAPPSNWLAGTVEGGIPIICREIPA